MTASRARGRLTLGSILALALVVLALMLPRSISDQAADVSPTAPPAPSATLQRSGLTQNLSSPQPIATVNRLSLPDEWAAEVLNSAATNINGAGPLPTARAVPTWLPDDSLWGILDWTENGLQVGGTPAAIDQPDSIKVFVPRPTNFDSLSHIASVERLQASLTLTIIERQGNTSSVRNLSGSIPSGAALQSLVETASTRQIQLLAAYWETPGGGASLVLIDLALDNQELTPTATSPRPATPRFTATATATLVYQPEIKAVLEDNLTPYLHIAPPTALEAINTFVENHSWAGTLSWEADGPHIAGRPLNLATANQLELFRLDATRHTTTNLSLLNARWDGFGTTVETDSHFERYFGFRLLEITHQLILIALENGGQLQAAYDDLGGYRALTIIQYHPLTLPPTDLP